MIIAIGLTYHRVETIARLRDRKIQSWYSFPAGIEIGEVRRIDANLVRAFGNNGSRTIATPANHPDLMDSSDSNNPG